MRVQHLIRAGCAFTCSWCPAYAAMSQLYTAIRDADNNFDLVDINPTTGEVQTIVPLQLPAGFTRLVGLATLTGDCRVFLVESDLGGTGHASLWGVDTNTGIAEYINDITTSDGRRTLFVEGVTSDGDSIWVSFRTQSTSTDTIGFLGTSGIFAETLSIGIDQDDLALSLSGQLVSAELFFTQPRYDLLYRVDTEGTPTLIAQYGPVQRGPLLTPAIGFVGERLYVVPDASSEPNGNRFGNTIREVDWQNDGQLKPSVSLTRTGFFEAEMMQIDGRYGGPCEPCVPDVNRDGMLTTADFNAWILAFNDQTRECDQNGDGLCNPADFNAWILNFNAGCP